MFVGSSNHPSEDLNVYASAFNKSLSLLKKLLKKGAKKLGLRLKKREAEAEFKKMDANGGGIVLFDEFCVWFTKKIDPTREIATCTSQFVERRTRGRK